MVFSRTLNLMRKKSEKNESNYTKEPRKMYSIPIPPSQEFSKLKNELLMANIKNENLVKILKEKEREQVWSQTGQPLSNPGTRNEIGDSLRKSLKGIVKRSPNVGSLIIGNAISVSNQAADSMDSPTFAFSSPRPSLPPAHVVQQQSHKKKYILDLDAANPLRGSREGSQKTGKFSQHHHESLSNSRNRTSTNYEFKNSFVEDDFNLYDHSFYSNNFTFK